jgi:hypothetical protein
MRRSNFTAGSGIPARSSKGGGREMCWLMTCTTEPEKGGLPVSMNQSVTPERINVRAHVDLAFLKLLRGWRNAACRESR